MASGLGASLEFQAVQIPGIESPDRPLVNSSAASVGPMGQNPGTGATAPPPSRTAPASSPPPVVSPVAMASISPTNFNSDGGYTATPWPGGGTGGSAQALAVQSNGQIVTAGGDLTQGKFQTSQFAVARYTSGGALDTTYGSGGSTSTLVSRTTGDVGQGLALQADGKSVVVGQLYDKQSNQDVAVLRYNTDGSLDRTFNGSGWVTTVINTANKNSLGIPYAVGIQSQGTNAGKIIAAGWTIATVNRVQKDYSLILRYTPGGHLDSGTGGFGQSGSTGALGYAITNVNPNGDDQIDALVIQPDDKIVAAGQTGDWPDDQLTLVRYNADGSLDTTFGGNNTGTLVLTLPGLDWTSGNAVALQYLPQPDGTTAEKILVAGRGRLAGGTSADFLVYRFNADGTLDTTFGGQGYTLVGNGQAAGVAVDASGRIIVGGSGSDSVSVARLSPDGTVDTTFGTIGVKTVTPAGSTDTEAYGLAIASDGSILVSGQTGDSANGYYPLLVHFNNTP
jgi:uncharacterized delta-60 repeat protein